VLYIFAGYPKNNLHAGGLQLAIESIEMLGELEHDPAVQYRKEGVFAANTDEELYPLEVVMSPMLEHDGITWDWFPENWSFGNGVTVHLTWLVTTHRFPDFAYERIRALVEDGATPEQAEIYICPDEPGKYLSTPRLFKEEQYAIPQYS